MWNPQVRVWRIYRPSRAVDPRPLGTHVRCVLRLWGCSKRLGSRLVVRRTTTARPKRHAAEHRVTPSELDTCATDANRRGDALYEVPRLCQGPPAHAQHAQRARVVWARGASHCRGEGVTSQHLADTWSRRALRAAHVTEWPSWGRGAPRPRAKGAGRPFWYIRAAKETSPGSIATAVPPCGALAVLGSTDHVVQD